MAQTINVCPLCGGTWRCDECCGECSNTPESMLLSRALARVESASIRGWAITAHNRPLWLAMARGAIDRHVEPDVSMFAALIVATAIGL